MARLLSRLNVVQIDIVGNGQEAVDLERVQPFDLVLMDLQMPVLDGLGACQQIVARHAGDRYLFAPAMPATEQAA